MYSVQNSLIVVKHYHNLQCYEYFAHKYNNTKFGECEKVLSNTY